MFWAAMVSFWALPPCIAFLERAGPSTKGRPARAHRSARQYQGKRHATQTTRSSREGAMALRNGAGPAGMFRCTRISPSWCKTQRDMVRACRSMPQYNWCCFV